MVVAAAQGFQVRPSSPCSSSSSALQRVDVRWFLLCENLRRRILAWSAGRMHGQQGSGRLRGRA